MPLIIEPDPELKNNLMAFGWECDSGWYPLIQELIEKLNEYPEEMHLMQVKEKYGTLRFYISNGSEEIFELIHRYEWFSSHICEICGDFWTSKNRDKHGWYKTLCDKHNEEYQKS